MLKTILNLKGVQVLNKNKQQTINGGDSPFPLTRRCYAGGGPGGDRCVCVGELPKCESSCRRAGCHLL